MLGSVAAAGLCGQDVQALAPALQADGYAMDTTGDEHGDTKIQGYKVQDLVVGETNDSTEARAWIPFVLTEEQKVRVLQPGVSVTLRLFSSSKTNVAGLRAEVHGSGYRTAFRVNQSDYGTLRKKLVPNAFSETSAVGLQYEFDVSAFVREEAARPDAAGCGLGFLLQVHDENLVPVSDGVSRAFRIGATGRTNEMERPALVIATRAPVANPPDPEPPDPRAVRVLIIGNSILKNSPLPDIGWAGNWGMAASAPGKDFSHLLMLRIEAALAPRPVVFMRHNMAFWESTWSVIRHDIPLVTYATDFDPDIIISCISENTGLRDDQVDAYAARYTNMILAIAEGSGGRRRRADVIVRGSFWTINPNTDLALSRVAAAQRWPYVACSDLGVRENQAWTADYYLGPDPVDASVKNHPNDRGMQAIADRIWEEGGLHAPLSREYVPPVATVGYEAWSEVFGLEKRTSFTGPWADFDEDGRVNLLEYAQGTDALAPEEADTGVEVGPVPSMIAAAGVGGSPSSALALRFRLRADDAALGYAVGWSPNLQDWSWKGLAFASGAWVSGDPARMKVVDQSAASDAQWWVTVIHRNDATGKSGFGRLQIGVVSSVLGE